MSTTSDTPVPLPKPQLGMGNLLGEVRGENDKRMLSEAFIETASYEALIHRNDFNFVVGRRGAGKSALFQKVAEKLRKEATGLIEERPEEEHILAFQETLKKVAPDYRTARIVTRLTWKGQILTTALRSLRDHYKSKKLDALDFIEGYLVRHRDLFDRKGTLRSLYFLQQMLRRNVPPAEIPMEIANIFELNKLQEVVESSFEQIGRRVVMLYDGLDEGWIPTPIATAILGGLAKAAADFADHGSGIHCILFIRDNMFRALAQFDNDFTRNIEGNSMRLHWEEETLLSLAAARLRIAFNLSPENDIKIWNRFAHRELRNREGFRRCLKYTLYRPRDLIVLLNKAYAVAASAGRDGIIEADLESTATIISQSRFEDLLKEYDEVLPGLRLFANLFKGRPAIDTLEGVLRILDEAVQRTNHPGIGARDFVLLGSGQEIFSALYSVGFLGAGELGSDRFTFCHDGSNSNLSNLEPTRKIIIHPCYWKALEIRSDIAPQDIFIQIDDEEDEKKVGIAVIEDVQELRVKRLGQIVEEFHRIPFGSDDAFHLEKWVQNAIQMLFPESLSNIELRHNSYMPGYKDIVATNIAERGFWKRILQDYDARHILIIAKNESDLREEDVQHVARCMSGQNGRIALLITRSEHEGLSTAERKWVKDVFDKEGKLILIIPGFLLARAQSKLRAKKKRVDYAEDLLAKRLDTHERSYIAR